MKIYTLALFCAANLLSGLSAWAQIPAFPGAEGFGAQANGGRGGDVYTVVNLNSSGPGSLKYGVDNAPAGGRTIVFAVSGYIPIVNDSGTGDKTLHLVQNNITIAGQTAPGDGIGLKDGRILVTGNNEVIRDIRIRHGKYGGAGDCLNLDSSAHDTIIDHVSLMFSTDENISFFSSSLDNFTFQYSTSSWGMERHNAGGLWDMQHVTCHHTLWAHHRTRNPKARPSGLLEWINNVTYHWRYEGFIMGDTETPADYYANVMGCYYLSIPDYNTGLQSVGLVKARIDSDGVPNFHLFLTNCLFDANGNGQLDGIDKGYGMVDGQPYDPAEGAPAGTVRYYKSDTPFSGAPVPVAVDDPLTAYKKVVSSAGAVRMDASATSLRDELDTLLVDSVTNQESILVAKDSPVTTDPDEPPSNGEQHLADAYGISNNGFGTLHASSAPVDTDGDGMPDYWENALGWNAVAQDHNTLMPSSAGYLTGLSFFPAGTPAGYTRLEEYLHFMAIPHASIAENGSLDVDLRRYTGGFSESPVFTFSNVVNGTAEILPDGHTVRFTPTADFVGRSLLDFTVTDADGSTWTQTLAMLVSNAFVPPGAPGSLNATPVSSYQVDLSWTDNADNESGFRIDRSADGVSFNQINTVSANTTSYSDSGLTPASTYYYRVRAFNDYANSSYSSTASATTPSGAPAPPSGLSETSGNHEVSLSWTASPGATGYVVKRASTSGGPYASISTNAATGYVDSGLVNGTTYFYVVSALNAYGESANASEVRATPIVSIKINAGGPAAGSYAADSDYSGGGTYENAGTIDTSGVVDPAPSAVYTTERNGNCSYTIPGLDPRIKYLVRLHFAEIYHTSSGARVFNVRINGTEVLSNYDIYAETGARYKATVREFTMPADASGQIKIEFETVVDNAKVSAIEVLSAPEPPASPATLNAVADTTVRYGIDQDSNFGTSTTLYTRQYDTAPRDYMAYIRFDLSSIPDAITDATFQLTKASGDTLVNGRVRVIGLDNVAGNTAQGWGENSITWNTLGSEIDTSIYPSPAPGESPLDFSRVTDFEQGTPGITEAITGNYTVLDLSGSTLAAWLESRRLDGGLATLIVDFPTGAAGKEIYYYSREAGNNPPILTLGFQTAAPTAPTGLSAQATGSSVSLDWNDNGEPDFSSYTLYRSTTSGSGYAAIASGLGTSTYTDSNVDSNMTYYYVVTATDTSYNESDFSTEAIFPDSDADGLSDSWELQYFGNLGQTGTGDPDGDGVDNATEQANGTNPTISNIPPVVDILFDNGYFNLSWPSNHIGWHLEYRTNLVGSGTATNWISIPEADGTNVVGIPLNEVPGDHAYFRLMLP